MEGTDPMDLAMELKELLDKAPDDTIILTDLLAELLLTQQQDLH